MLLGEPMIGGQPGTGTARLLQQALGVDASSLKIGLELGSTEAVKQAVRAGLGLSITFESAVRDEVGAGTLRALRVAETPLAKPLFSISPAGIPTGSPAGQFHAFLQNAGPGGRSERWRSRPRPTARPRPPAPRP
jgi:DNA-binding transcriptional LysR family regulator